MENYTHSVYSRIPKRKNQHEEKIMNTYISIAEDFSPFAAGRYRNDGPYTGQHFREDMLVHAFNSYDFVKIDLAGMFGLTKSFLEESFGGLVREHGFNYKDLLAKLVLMNGSVEDHRFIINVITLAGENK